MSGETPSDDPPRLDAEQLRAIYRHAREQFPCECCGYVVGRGPQAELVACTNVQDELHALDPDAFPRTAETAYSIGGAQLLRLTRLLDEDEPPPIIIYHSHPRVGAYFSGEDERSAIAAGWPVDYLVVDVQEDEIVEALLFRRDGDSFEQIARFAGERL
ncbi:MAG: Mov34/MPN/PAD-1 family protein [Myxococcales bacterium]|nr:Mov34/MPN/PAD-1 family protein [Myxococcales bacterium]